MEVYPRLPKCFVSFADSIVNFNSFGTISSPSTRFEIEPPDPSNGYLECDS